MNLPLTTSSPSAQPHPPSSYLPEPDQNRPRDQVSKRLLALDAFRGFTIALMILVNNPGSWSYVYPPFRHAVWHGCTPTDLVFPFFLFIVGVSMRYALDRHGLRWSSTLAVKLVHRSLWLVLLGVAMHAFPFILQDWDFSRFRYMGVLQRIGLCYGIAALICVSLERRPRLWVMVSLLLSYWAALYWLGGDTPYALEGNLVGQIDQLIMGNPHLWHGNGVPFDPEGLLSTLPATVTVMLGFEIGHFLKQAKLPAHALPFMIRAGSAMVISGWLWSFWFPLNKQLWTSSFTLFTGGWACLFLALCIWFIDVQGYRRMAYPMIVFGSNALFIFVASGLWAKTWLKIPMDWQGHPISSQGYLFRSVFQPFAGDYNGSLLYALCQVTVWWVVANYLYRHKIWIKL